MGAQLSTVAPTATVPIDAYVAELGDLSYSADLGRSRFLKTVRAVHREGHAVVKVFIRPTTGQIDIGPFKQQVRAISEKLRRDLGPSNQFPNTIGYSRVVETDRAGYLVRQYIRHNLYDRISTRPFLEVVEKKWIAYQLLRALKACHSQDIFHGDIKSENVLVGSWKWVYLTDFAPFKPVRLPETDSAQFLFYFDVSQRRACYVAPERFADDGPLTLNSQMDVYSAGCVIAELFMDGQSLLSLADLFKYRRGEWKPNFASISDDERVQELVRSMTSVDPSMRKNAAEYLDEYRGTLFPEYFDTFWDLLSPMSGSVGATSSNDMIEHAWTRFESEILPIFTTNSETEGVPTAPAGVLPVVVPLDNWVIPKHTPIPPDCGAVIILSYICSALTSTSTVEWKLRAAYLVLVLAQYVPDDIKLDRCLPYLVVLLRDPQTEVRVRALALIAHLSSMVETYSPLNAKVYTAFLFPRINQAVTAGSPAEVRAMLANVLPRLAQSAVKCEGWDDVVGYVDETTRFLLVDKVGIVRRSLLNNADTLCTVLRKQGTNDIILLHAITYLNDKDPYVRTDLFRFIVKVAPLVGPATIEQYVAPLMIQSLCDPREDIVAQIIQSLAAMVEVGLVRLNTLLGSVIPVCAKFLIHPNVYIRTQTLTLVAVTAAQLSKAQVFCLLRPLIAPYLTSEVGDYEGPGALLEALRPSLSQPVYSLALRWAANSSKSQFWQQSGHGHASTQSLAFSPDDRRWLASLREVGFNNEDLWQLLAFREYLWQLSLMPAPTASIPPSELEPIDGVPMQDSQVEPVVVANGSTRLRSKRGLASWREGNTIPQGLEEYIKAKQSDAVDITQPLGLVIGSIVFDERAWFISSPTEDTNGTSPQEGSEWIRATHKPSPTTLVSSMKAHRGAIHVLEIHRNNRHFLTAADDGLVKLWDVRQLLKGSSRPVATWESGGTITSASFIGDTSVAIIGTGESELVFLNFAFKRNELGQLIFENVNEIAKLTLEGNSIALHCCDRAGVSVKSDQFSGQVTHVWALLSTGSISRMELASMKVDETLLWPREHGSPSHWVWETHGDWVLVGTLHGMLELFDMRFLLHVNAWGIGQLKPITAMIPHPSKEKHICISGGFKRNLISVWDIEKLECRELLVPVSDLDDIEDDSELPSLDPIMGTQESLLERFASWNIEDSVTRKKPPVTAMAATSKGYNLLTGGGDRILRYWDLRSPYQTTVVSGLNYTRGKLSYMGKVGSAVKYTYETWAPNKNPERLARSAIISCEEQDIGRNHRGSITRVGLLEQPRIVAISVDEIGVIKVYA